MNKTFPLLVAASLCVVHPGQGQTPPALRFNGDFRVRYEHTSKGNSAPNLDREVVRLRLRRKYRYL